MRHCSSIHNLLATFQAYLGEVKTIDTTRSTLRGGHSIPYIPHIAINKDQAIQQHDTSHYGIKIYSDDSAHREGVAAAVVLYRPGKAPWTLAYYLGSDKHHTVYKAEVIGLTLAVQLLLSEDSSNTPITIYIDNKVAILSSESPSSTAGSYLMDKFIRLAHVLKKKYTDQELDLRLLVK